MLYEVIIGNHLDDTLRSIFVLSVDQIHKEYPSINVMLGIDPEYEYIRHIKSPNVVINAWTEEEYDKLNEIRKQII